MKHHSLLINTFIPHKHNKYKPHLIKHYGLVGVLALLILMQGIFNWQNAGTFRVLGYATNVNVSGLLSYTNQNRAANGLGNLKLNSKLNSAAQSKAQHMIANDYWAHTAPTGETPWYFISASGYSYNKAGENLAYGFSTSAGTVQGWMDSPGHRANILDSSFKDVGFGIANGSNFQGGENTVVVAMYGQPVASSPAPKPAAAAPVAAAPAPTEQSAPAKKQQPKKEKQAEPKEEKQAEEAEEEITLNKLLRDSPQDSVQVTAGNLDDLSQVKGSNISNFAALVNGQAHWSLYVSLGAVMAVAVIYAMRHAAAIYQVIAHGEQYVVGHPLLEAGLIYAALWLVLAGSYGAVL